MGASMIYSYAPNRLAVDDTDGTTAWHIVSGFPGLDPGMFCQSVTVEAVSSASAAGSIFFVAWNTATTPTDATATLVPSGVLTIPGDIHNLWIRKTDATDNIVCTALY